MMKNQVKLDAIIMPTVNQASHHKHAVSLARKLGAVFLAFHGRTQLERLKAADIAKKRNTGIETARKRGWRYIMLLDDDIRFEANQVQNAVMMLASYPAVTFRATDYPDHSVIYHAYVMAGGKHDVRPGGGALLLDTSYPHGSFLPVYNDDWFFLHDITRMNAIADAGEVRQLPYNPFITERARAEEFGDLLGEGLYRLIDEQRPVEDALEEDFWAGEILRRQKFTSEISSRSNKQIREILAASAEELSRITPASAAAFIREWRKLP